MIRTLNLHEIVHANVIVTSRKQYNSQDLNSELEQKGLLRRAHPSEIAKMCSSYITIFFKGRDNNSVLS